MKEFISVTKSTSNNFTKPLNKIISGKKFPSIANALTTSVFCLGLGACGGGGGSSSSTPPPTTQQTFTGVFIDGPVEGLRYETATQSGLTNENGEFTYQAGETVTFSIGGITLGSAPATDEINPFDLFGMTPPSTESEIRELKQDYEKVTDFDRVANIALLLVSLDKDNNPDNGLDISGWDEKLTTANLSFDETITRFFYGGSYDSFSNEHGIKKIQYISTPLTHLYSSLDINVPVSLLTQQTRDNGNDGTIDRSYTFNYNNQGNNILYSSDGDNDGNAEYIRKRTYNTSGNRLSRTYEYDNDDDGTIDSISIEEWSYNDEGYRTLKIEEEYSNDVTADYRAEIRYSYDANGNLISRIEEIDSDGDGVLDEIYSQSSSFNEYDYLISHTAERDTDGNGSIDEIQITTYSHNTMGFTTNITVSSDNDADGAIDRVYRILRTYTDDGLLSEWREEFDELNDGILDRTRVDQNVYDENANRVAFYREKDIDGDGIIDETEEDQNTYDDDNNLLLSEKMRDTDNDGTPDYIVNITYTYNEFGDQLTDERVLIKDSSDPASVPQSERTEYTYDENRNILKRNFSRDLDGDGIIDIQTVYDFTYNDNNQVITELYKYDSDADGVPENEWLEESTYSIFEDGFDLLINSLVGQQQ